MQSPTSPSVNRCDRNRNQAETTHFGLPVATRLLAYPRLFALPVLQRRLGCGGALDVVVPIDGKQMIVFLLSNEIDISRHCSQRT